MGSKRTIEPLQLQPQDGFDSTCRALLAARLVCVNACGVHGQRKDAKEYVYGVIYQASEMEWRLLIVVQDSGSPSLLSRCDCSLASRALIGLEPKPMNSGKPALQHVDS